MLFTVGEKEQEKAEVRYPEPSAAVEYFRGRIPQLRSAADSTKPLSMPHKAFLALVNHFTLATFSERQNSNSQLGRRLFNMLVTSRMFCCPLHVCMLSFWCFSDVKPAEVQVARKDGDAKQSLLLLAQITFLRQCCTANGPTEASLSESWSETYLGEHALVLLASVTSCSELDVLVVALWHCSYWAIELSSCLLHTI